MIQETGNKMKKKTIKVTKGQKIYSLAKKIIPGGNMLLSKNPSRFLTKGWPVYFNKTKGLKKALINQIF